MLRKSYGIAALALLATAGAWPRQPGSEKPSRAIVLERAELKLTPAALVFDGKGELYVGYRDEGADKKSSAIWVRVFDPASGKELRSAQFQTATVALPNGAEQFLLSPDDSLLLYSQFHGSTFLTIFKAATLQTVSESTMLPAEMSKEFPRVAGITPDDQAALVTSEITNKRNGVDIRLAWLSVHALTRVLKEEYVPNPYVEASYAIDRKYHLWLTRADALYRYDPASRKSDLRLTVPTSTVPVFIADGELLLYSNRNEFGELYRFDVQQSSVQNKQRIEGCGINQVRVSRDELYGVALCEHQNMGELRFGAITKREAVVFDTKTLKILDEVPIAKNLYPELALWHGGGKVVLATQADSNKVAIYEFPVPKPTGQSATVYPKNGNLHLAVPVPVSAKKQ